jgi:hypothetical protein
MLRVSQEEVEGEVYFGKMDPLSQISENCLLNQMSF